jgi:coenzyme F420-0:L-glutamate ligase/coenzyme F420-1:gamma-L-glutamate ligase
MTLQIFALDGIGEVRPGDDLAALTVAAANGQLRDGDILAVTSKIVSKAEDRFVQADDREQAITDETVRLVASRETPGGTVRIVQNRLGIIAAAAGVDSSSVPVGTVLLLPEDPDRSARILVDAIRERLGIRVGVIVTDTLGRAWRVGQTDAAIGIAGMDAVEDLRGTRDEYGQEMNVTITATADAIPIAVIRGLGHLVHDEPRPVSAADLLRPHEEDMFHTGAAESWAAGYAAALREHGIEP